MGGCCSSDGKVTWQHGGGGVGYGRPQCQVQPSDEDGKGPPAGTQTVDHKAEMYIANFYRRQSSCAEDAAMAPPTPAPAPA